MTKFDQESFNLLKMTDSGSESLPDLTFDLPNDNRQKKKVRLKRKERKATGRGGGGGHPPAMAKLRSSLWCPALPRPALPSPSHAIGLLGVIGLLALAAIGFFTSNLHYKIQLLEDQLRAKKMDDDAKSVPETLETIKSRLRALESNQTSVSGQLEQINTAVSDLSARLDSVSSSLSVAGEDPASLRQSVAELREGVGEVTKHLETVKNSSIGNFNSITKLTKELNRLKLNEIDMKNGQDTGPESNLSSLHSQLASLNSSLELHGLRLAAINNTMLGIEHNSTARIELEHDDVVTLTGKVSQLQDDNLNVSSSLASLSARCSSELRALRVNVTRLQEVMAGVEDGQVAPPVVSLPVEQKSAGP